MFNVKRLVVVCCLGAALFAMGCGSKDEFGRDMVPVKGKVTINGEPVKANKNLMLIFQKGTERPESLEVQPDGTFSGQVVPGENTVVLQIYGPPDALGAVKKDYLPGGTGKLTVNVESGKEITLDIGK